MGELSKHATVLIDESLAGLKARCWVQPSHFSQLELSTWWEQVAGSDVGWSQNDIRVFGKWHREPRLTAWWGPTYRYANVHWPERPMHGWIRDLNREVSDAAGFEFNAVLVNGYRNGQDAMGWHRDNEPEIDATCIASVSLGATRTFKIRDRRNQSVLSVELGHGDLLVMENLQDVHEHSVPRRAKVKEPRMNFTFRRLV